MVPPREEELAIDADADAELVAVDEAPSPERPEGEAGAGHSEMAFVEAPPSEQPPGLVPTVSLKGLFEGDAGPEGPVDPVLSTAHFSEGGRSVREEVATSTSASRPATGVTDGTSPEPHSGSRRKGPRRSGSDVDLPSPGAIIDKYRLEEMVGKGGFAAVYRATHLLLNMPVAIKLLRPKAMKKHPNLAALLCEEARFAAKIDHPNVVRIHDVTHTPAITYIVMEFLDGGTLAQLIREQGRLSPTRVIRIGLDVASGLKAGLDQGLIHRDIKPSNILFTRTGATKIVDLGLAQTSGAESPSAGEEQLRKLSVVGTPAYMAPEQGMHPGRVDFRADIYALGVTLYHAAVGRPPFPIDNADRVMAMHRTEPVPPPENVLPRFPLPLSRLLLKMLEKNPAARHESYDALAIAMQEALGEIALAVPSP